MKHIGLQLYSVGADMGKDVYATLKRTAELGYTGVEFAGYFGIPAEQMKAWLDELGLKRTAAIQMYLEILRRRRAT